MKTRKNSRTVLGRHFDPWHGTVGLIAPSRRRGVLAQSPRLVHARGGTLIGDVVAADRQLGLFGEH
jgi:hypothetical protein